jgi:salicylate hydroxylase
LTSVAVVGGGIGGLSAALCLTRAGLDVQVYEQARELREVGAGLQIAPNATRVLHGLGLADELATMGVRPLAWHMRRWEDGRTLMRQELGDAVVEEFGFPYYQMHRGDLQGALGRALPAGRLHVGHRLVGLEDVGARVRARFENGVEVEADLLVGADGIHSVVRTALLGLEKPEFTGCVAYRGLIPAERVTHLEIPVEAQLWMGPGKHFVHYYVQNRRLLNFVAVFEQDSWTTESWTERGDVNEALAAFAGWHPQVTGILGAVEETFTWALHGRPPLERWSVGRVTLLGDACHPMLPFMAQGAVQAIEDGTALATLLAPGGHVEDALRRYESLRRPRTSRVQQLSRENKGRYHLADGPDQLNRDEGMGTTATDFSFDSVRWLYGYDAAAEAAAVGSAA